MCRRQTGSGRLDRSGGAGLRHGWGLLELLQVTFDFVQPLFEPREVAGQRGVPLATDNWKGTPQARPTFVPPSGSWWFQLADTSIRSPSLCKGSISAGLRRTIIMLGFAQSHVYRPISQMATYTRLPVPAIATCQRNPASLARPLCWVRCVSLFGCVSLVGLIATGLVGTAHARCHVTSCRGNGSTSIRHREGTRSRTDRGGLGSGKGSKGLARSTRFSLDGKIEGGVPGLYDRSFLA